MKITISSIIAITIIFSTLEMLIPEGETKNVCINIIGIIIAFMIINIVVDACVELMSKVNIDYKNETNYIEYIHSLEEKIKEYEGMYE